MKYTLLLCFFLFSFFSSNTKAAAPAPSAGGHCILAPASNPSISGALTYINATWSQCPAWFARWFSVYASSYPHPIVAAFVPFNSPYGSASYIDPSYNSTPTPSCSSLSCSTDAGKSCKNASGAITVQKACNEVDKLPNGCTTDANGESTCPIDLNGDNFKLTLSAPSDPLNDPCVIVGSIGSDANHQINACLKPHNCGYVNGHYACYESEGTTTTPKDPNWKNNNNCFTLGDGSIKCIKGEEAVTTNESSHTTINNDGSSTITTTTVNNIMGSVPVVTTTQLNADGSVKSVQRKGKPKEQPKKSASGFGGCSAPPVCSGDPILCAIARTEHDRRCQVDNFKTPTDQQFTNKLNLVPNNQQNNSTPFSIDTLDLNGFGISRVCPAPKTVSVIKGITFQLDYSPLCSIANIIGYLIIIGASFVSLRILGSA